MAEKIVTLVITAMTAIYLYQARQFSFGSLLAPQAGFMPAILGAAALLLALLLLLRNRPRPETADAEPIDWYKFICIVSGGIFYLALFNVIGYYAASFIFLFYLFKINMPHTWKSPLIIAAVTSSIFYFIFKHYLAVALP